MMPAGTWVDLLDRARTLYAAPNRLDPRAAVDTLALEYPEQLRSLVEAFAPYSDHTCTIGLMGLMRAKVIDFRWVSGVVAELRKL